MSFKIVETGEFMPNIMSFFYAKHGGGLSYEMVLKKLFEFQANENTN